MGQNICRRGKPHFGRVPGISTRGELLNMKKIISVFFLAIFLVFPAACAAAPAEPTATGQPPAPTLTAEPTGLPTDEPAQAADPHFPPEVVEYVQKLVDEHKVPGISIGLLTPEGEFYYSYGTITWESEQKIDEHTLFEIGSITKVFTATLLANAVQQGLVTLDTPAQDLAPDGVTMPVFAPDHGMTLRDIASQRSGLPRMPSNFNPAVTLNPYADYTPELMYEYLDGLRLGRKPGDQYEYSNLGFMLLGDLLERAYERPYADLVREIITSPLDMPDTVITLSEEQQTRLAQAHSGPYPVQSWDFVLPAVGALRSTTSDMLKFLAANTNPPDDQLGRSIQLIRNECYETGTSFIEVCLGIHTYHRFSEFMYQHDGQTGGYHSFSAFNPEDGTAVIVLANSNTDIGAIGLRLMDPEFPLPDYE